MRTRRTVNTATARKRERQAQALIRFVQSIERPIQPVPAHETECERRVRALEDVIERFRLYEQAGLLQGWQRVRTGGSANALRACSPKRVETCDASAGTSETPRLCRGQGE